MKKSHSGFWLGLVGTFSAAVYSVVLFLLKKQFNISAWMLYSFTMLSFLLLTVHMIAATRKSETFILDSALAFVTIAYFLVQFMVGGIICMFFSRLPETVVLVCELLLHAGYLVIAFFMYGAQSDSASQTYNGNKSVCKLLMLETEVLDMAQQQKDAALKDALKSLAEEIHFSDPTTLPALKNIDRRIVRNIETLQDELNNKAEDAYERIDLIQRLLKERNRTAVIMKK